MMNNLRSRLLVWSLTPLIVLTAQNGAGIDVTVNEASVQFPEGIDFHLQALSDVPIESAELRFHTDAQVCGGGDTQATPEDFVGGTNIVADWSWEFRRTGSQPPGTTITWHWVLNTEDGESFETEEQSITLEDTTHNWQSIEADGLTLYWYEGDQAFAETLQSAGEQAISNLEATLGIEVDTPIRIYTYANSDDMQSATLFAPAWSGGLAFSRNSALLMAVGPTDLEWGQRALAHELTHVVEGYYTFSCVNSAPTWFEEGLAMYMEGAPEAYYTSILDQAVSDNELLSVRELGHIFSGNSELATLSYAQSQSLVTYLIDEHGEDKLLLLLDQWKQGSSEDKALTEVYGFDRDGLEVAWRAWIGAPPMEIVPQEAQATYTPYPTFAPIGEPPDSVAEVRPTPNYITEPIAGAEAEPESDGGGTFLAVLAAGTTCLLLMVVAAVIGAVVWSRRRNAASVEG
jgi:hypothetical protein